MDYELEHYSPSFQIRTLYDDFLEPSVTYSKEWFASRMYLLQKFAQIPWSQVIPYLSDPTDESMVLFFRDLEERFQILGREWEQTGTFTYLPYHQLIVKLQYLYDHPTLRDQLLRISDETLSPLLLRIFPDNI